MGEWRFDAPGNWDKAWLAEQGIDKLGLMLREKPNKRSIE